MRRGNIKKVCRGFSLIEILAAMAILTIGLLSILAIFPVGVDSYRKARNDTILANLVRSKVNELLYILSDPNMEQGKSDPSKIIARSYLRHDRAFAQYMDETDKNKQWSGPVYESEVYQFENNPDYFWQYTVHDIGISGDTKIGKKGTKGVFFQVEFKVYQKDQIETENVPMDLSIVKEEQIEKPILRQVFRVHNPYPATKYGKK
jgi:prepilin-type N-terminal cleavage/methylation domain-containing protein